MVDAVDVPVVAGAGSNDTRVAISNAVRAAEVGAAGLLHVAGYYMRRGAFVAAANRAKYVLETYQQTPSVVPALQIMVSAYRQMGLDQLADDSMAVLSENYPDQAYAYGERGTEVEGTLIERLVLRRNLRFWGKKTEEEKEEREAGQD